MRICHSGGRKSEGVFGRIGSTWLFLEKCAGGEPGSQYSANLIESTDGLRYNNTEVIMLSMCLGMQVINDELQDIVYERRLKEKAGDLLVNVRMITLQGNHSLSPKYVYLGFENDFLPFANDRNLSAAICIGKTSLQEEIFFEGTDLICVKDGDINQIFERVQLIFEKYNQWDEELTNAIMAQASINDIADIGNKVFSNPIAIFDSSFYCLATSGDLSLQYKDPIWDTLSKTKYVINYDIQTRLKQALGKQLSESKETILLKQFDGGANKPFDILIRHIFKNGIRLGNIGMTEVWAPITYGQTFLCDHFANRLTYWFCCSRNIIASKEPIKQLVTQTSHIKNGICSLKNQYYRS